MISILLPGRAVRGRRRIAYYVLLLKALKISPGKYTEEGCRRLDMDRVCGAEYKHSDERKKRRKVLRGQRKKKEDKNQQAEGVTYAAGAF